MQRDEIIFLYKLACEGQRDLFLRRIEVWDETQQRPLIFLTNHRHFAASTRPIDLVITDHLLPGRTGAHLAAHIKHHKPDIPIALQ